MHLVDQKFAVFDAAPCVLQVHRTCADGFDFRAYQLDTGFKFFFHEVFMVCFPVPGHDFDALLFQMYHLLRYVG